MQTIGNSVAPPMDESRTKDPFLTSGEKCQEVAAAAAPKSTDSTTKTSTDEAEQWLHQALTCLGHPQPELHVRHVFETNLSATDAALHPLVLWLEDRCIRLWDLERRDSQLRLYSSPTAFLQEQLPLYLQALDCPPSYYTMGSQLVDSDGGKHHEQPQWYACPQQRYRVVHWLVSCAIQEVAADQAAAAVENQTAAETDTADAATTAVDPEAFPLGFSTGDAEVDHVLTLLRMQLVASMQVEQQAINRAVLAAATKHRKEDNNGQQQEPKLKPSFHRNGGGQKNNRRSQPTKKTSTSNQGNHSSNRRRK